MTNCRYKFKDKNDWMAYNKIIEALKASVKSGEGDYFIYSASVQELYKNLILTFSQESKDFITSKFPATYSLSFSEANEELGDPESGEIKHLLTYLNTNDVFINEVGLKRLTDDEINERYAYIIKSKNPSISPEDLKKAIEEEKKNFQLKAMHGYIMHLLINRLSNKRITIESSNVIDVLRQLKGEQESNADFGKVIDDLMGNNAAIASITNLLSSNSIVSTRPLGSTVLSNVYLSKKLKDGTTVYDKIDQVVIEANGTVHVYRIKTSSEDTNYWQRVQHDAKTDRYRYELAFIKSILKDIGIPSNKILLHFLTALLNYGEDLLNPGKIKLNNVQESLNPLQMDINNNRYMMGKHLRAADAYVLPKAPSLEVSDALNLSLRVILRIWPETGIDLRMINSTVDSWITENKRRIKPATNPEYSYEVTCCGETLLIKDKESDFLKNEELREAIEKQLDERKEDSEEVLSNLHNALISAFQTGHFNLTDAFKRSKSRITNIIETYLNDKYTDPATGDETCNWQLIDNADLVTSGIVLLKHRNGLLDVICLSDLKLDTVYKFRGSDSRTTLAGAIVTDLSSLGLEKSTLGNIYITRALIVLNEILKSGLLEDEDLKLGNIKVISSFDLGAIMERNIKHFNNTLLSVLFNIVANNNPSEGRIENVLGDLSAVNPVTLFTEYLKFSLLGGSWKELNKYKDRLDTLTSTASDGVKIDLLLTIISDFLNSTGLDKATLQRIAEEGDKTNINTSAVARMAIRMMKALNYLLNLDVYSPKKIGALSKLFLRTGYIPSKNFKVIANMYNQSSQRINTEAFNVGQEINKICNKFYKACGYSDLRNVLIGDLTRMFTNLYTLDVSGLINHDMTFKNPWDPNSVLLPHEREFIKEALFIFTKYRFMNLGLNFSYTSANSSDFIDYVNKNKDWIFCVPLQKASESSALQTGYYFRLKYENLRRLITDPATYSKEIIEEAAISDALQEREIADSAWLASVANHFDIGDPEIVADEKLLNRDKVIRNHEDARYFETNLENILRDYTMEAIRSQLMRKLMAGAKLFSLAMYLQGKNNNNLSDYESELNYIDDFLKVTVFGLPLVEAGNIKLASNILKARSVVSKLFIAGNVAGSMRDVFEGFLQIMVKAITKHNTEFSVFDVTKAYGIVTKEMVTNMNTANILSLICILYRMSNIDVSRVSEGMKSAKGGLFHFLEVMYKTLKTPDFLNRMVYFVSQALHDGVYDAFYLLDDILKYDWKRDKRFILVATGNKTNIDEYNKQRGLLLYYLTRWNEENPEQQIAVGGDELPMPYSDKEMEMIHDKADAIWGAYDRSSKALGEYNLMGLTFGMFMTWMNGQISQYYHETLESLKRFEVKQLIDVKTGLPLWYDENMQPTTENTGIPVYGNVPIMVQGIWLTLKQMWHVLNTPGENLRDNVFNEQQNVENMKKLVTDAVITTIYFALIKAILAAMREKQKEIVDPHDLITNCICEVLYKGMYNSWDGFSGPIALINYLGSETSPPFYTESVQVAKDLFRTTFGDMTILSFGAHHLAPLRSIRSSLKAYETGKHPF